MARFCPQCGEYFDDATRICPTDHVELYAAGAGFQPRAGWLVGTTLQGRFKMRALLGTGGMGAVYRAVQTSVGRDVAIKVLHGTLDDEPTTLERFFREAKFISELTHSNIVRLIDFGQDPALGVVYLVMELIEGRTLDALVAGCRVDANFALEVAYQTLGGLTDAHRAGLVHRDLKPSNLFVMPVSDGSVQVKICDFGIARASHLTGALRLTHAGGICGTPAYMSPEQASDLRVDGRSDLYALGVILFEMLTGRLPFDAPGSLQLMLKHVQQPLPALQELVTLEQVPAPVQRLVEDLLAKSPDERPASALQARQRIQQIRQELGWQPLILDAEWPELSSDAPAGREIFAQWIYPLEEAGNVTGAVLSPKKVAGAVLNPKKPAFSSPAPISAQSLGPDQTLSTAQTSGTNQTIGTAETLADYPSETRLMKAAATDQGLARPSFHTPVPAPAPEIAKIEADRNPEINAKSKEPLDAKIEIDLPSFGAVQKVSPNKALASPLAGFSAARSAAEAAPDAPSVMRASTRQHPTHAPGNAAGDEAHSARHAATSEVRTDRKRRALYGSILVLLVLLVVGSAFGLWAIIRASQPAASDSEIQHEEISPVDPTSTKTRSGGPDEVPGTVKTAPDGSDMVPGTVKTAPDGSDMVPGTVKTAPDGSDIVPGTVKTVPDGPDEVPGTVKTAPDGSDMVPGTVKTAPDGSDMVPGTVKTAPDGSDGVPGTVRSAPDKRPNGVQNREAGAAEHAAKPVAREENGETFVEKNENVEKNKNIEEESDVRDKKDEKDESATPASRRLDAIFGGGGLRSD